GQGVAGSQPLRDLVETAVVKAARGALHHQQPGALPARRGTLGDPLGRQIVVEILDTHRCGKPGRGGTRGSGSGPAGPGRGSSGCSGLRGAPASRGRAASATPRGGSSPRCV